MNDRAAIEQVVYESGMRLDARDFNGYLSLCGEDFQYTITVYSPEIRKDMVWLHHDRTGMETLFKNLPKHNSDQSTLMRHLTVYRVDVNESRDEATAVTGLQVFRTDLDGGATDLFAVGKQYDVVKLNGGEPKLEKREIRLETRSLGIGHHIPF